MGRKLSALLVVSQPLLFGAGVVLSRYLTLPAAPDSIVRPLLVTVVLAAGALTVARLLTRSWTWAALLATLFVLFSLRESLPAAVLGAFAAWWLLVWALRRIQSRPPMSARAARLAARASSIYGLAFLVVTGASVGLATVEQPATPLPDYATAGTGGPSIYLILLDGYPRADTLADVFDIDNEPFLESLEEQGFSVTEQARSNYNKTWLTLASMLNAAYIEELLAEQRPPESEASQIRWTQALINASTVPELLRDRGYTIKAMAPPFTSTALTTADEYIDHGHLTEFEAKVTSASPWAALLRDEFAAFLAQSLKDAVVNTLEATARLAEESDGSPQLVLAHVHSPHPPFVLAASVRPMPDCVPVRCSPWDPSLEESGFTLDEYRTGLAEQLEALNDLVLSAVTRITRADPDAVIVVMSDHGSRYSLSDGEEHFKILYAVRSPGHPQLFSAHESPVNLFRRLSSAYFGTEMPALPYRAWLSDWNATLRLTPFPG